MATKIHWRFYDDRFPFADVPEAQKARTPLCLRGGDVLMASTTKDRAAVTCSYCARKLRKMPRPPGVKAILKNVDTGTYTVLGTFPTREEAKAALTAEAKRLFPVRS